MIYTSSNNVRHPVTKTFTTLHPTTLNSTSLPTVQITISFYSKERSYLCPDTAYTWATRIILTFILLMWRIWWDPNSIPIYIQQDATLHNLFISGNCSICFGWYFHPSSGAYTTVSTASGICHTITAICRYRRRVGTGLSVLWVGGNDWRVNRA
jgi:hypothetical protein